MFATLFFGLLDPTNGSLAYINGGHCPPLIIGPDGQIKETLRLTGPAVGMMPGAEFEVGYTQLGRGDSLLAYTDGVTDARDAHGKRFTDKRLKSLIQEEPVSSIAALLKRIEAHVHNHIGTVDQYDDITMVGVKYHT